MLFYSAGIGRTGTLIAIDILLQQIRDNKKLDVFGTVYRLRHHRINMVQREVSNYIIKYKNKLAKKIYICVIYILINKNKILNAEIKDIAKNRHLLLKKITDSIFYTVHITYLFFFDNLKIFYINICINLYNIERIFHILHIFRANTLIYIIV